MKYKLSTNEIENLRNDRKPKKVFIKRSHICESFIISELFYSIYTENIQNCFPKLRAN